MPPFLLFCRILALDIGQGNTKSSGFQKSIFWICDFGLTIVTVSRGISPKKGNPKSKITNPLWQLSQEFSRVYCRSVFTSGKLVRNCCEELVWQLAAFRAYSRNRTIPFCTSSSMIRCIAVCGLPGMTSDWTKLFRDRSIASRTLVSEKGRL